MYKGKKAAILGYGIEGQDAEKFLKQNEAEVTVLDKKFDENYLSNLNRPDRDTIGIKIDDIFLSLLEFIFRACFSYDKFEKLSMLSQAIAKNDLIKFFLQISWEQKILDHKQYGSLILLFDEVGRQLYGWKKDTQEKL